MTYNLFCTYTMTFDKSAIEEANKHLFALNERVVSLENSIREQATHLILKDKDHQENIERLTKEKDDEINSLKLRLEEYEVEMQKLKMNEHAKDLEISQLRNRFSLLQEAATYRSSLEGLLDCLNTGAKLLDLEFGDSVMKFEPKNTLDYQGQNGFSNAKPTVESNSAISSEN